MQTPSENDIGCARVSTTNQDEQLQHDALIAAGCYRIFTDTATGALQFRPQLDKLVDQLQTGDIFSVSRTTIYRALRRDPDFTPLQQR